MSFHRNVLSLSLFLLVAGSLLAGAKTFFYTGDIAGKLPIQMELSMGKTAISGYYRYESVWHKITLNGTLGANGAVRIKEKDDNGKLTGAFTGVFTAGQTRLSGTWKSTDGKRSYPFQVKAVAEYKPVVKKSGKITLDGQYPHLLTGTPPAEQLNHMLRAYIATNLDASDKWRKEVKARSDGFYYSFDMEISYYGGDVVSLLVWSSLDSSALPHPGTSLDSLLYSLPPQGSPKQLALSNLFDPKTNFRSPLFTMVKAELTRQQAAQDIDDSIWSDSPDDLDTYTLSPKAIIFIFPPYGPDSYTQGEFDISIPYRELEPYINPEGPLQRFIK